jgi:hypothetical protein
MSWKSYQKSHFLGNAAAKKLNIGVNPKGTPESRAIEQAKAVAEATGGNKVVPMPDMNDAAVRKRQADELNSLLKRRGRSSTLLSGRAGDQSATPMRKTILGRA